MDVLYFSQPTEFSFQVLGHINLKEMQQDKNQYIRKNLISVANIYGFVFVGCRDGFKVRVNTNNFQ